MTGVSTYGWPLVLAQRWQVRAVIYLITYVLLAALCLNTALVQANAAAVWMPSGFAVGVLIVEGRVWWPVIFTGSLLVNFATNVLGQQDASLLASLLVAAAIAAGNSLEGGIGAYLAKRFAGGTAFLENSRLFAVFCLLSPIPALISTSFGLTAIYVSGFGGGFILSELALTWFIANCVGIILFGCLTCLVLTRPLPDFSRHDWLQAGILVVCLAIFGQALTGVTFNDIWHDWPKTYMSIPLLVWAAVRFGSYGALFSLLVITLIAATGTMLGFLAYPASNPVRSLIYLQIYIGLVAVMTIALSTSLSEIKGLQQGLEIKVRDRTERIEQLLRDRETFTMLVVHDLKSPLYGVRNAARAAGDALKRGTVTEADIVSALQSIDETCEALALRVNQLLDDETVSDGGQGVDNARLDRLDAVLNRILRAHHLRLQSHGLTIRLAIDANPELPKAKDVEHILDVVIDNAIQHSASGGYITIAAHRSDQMIEIRIEDGGPGLDAHAIGDLFNAKPRGAAGNERKGLGLPFARERARRLGGDIALAGARRGAAFVVILPV